MTDTIAPSSTPRVSIGVPVYNGAATLAATLDSIAAQTVRDIEIIISDNASGDGTAAICRDHAARDPRIRYFRQPTTVTATENFKFVLRQARAPFFVWVAHDDSRDADFVEKLMTALESHPGAILAFGDLVRIDQGQPKPQPLDFVNTGRTPWQRLHWSAVSDLYHIYGLWRTEALRGIRWEYGYWWSDTPLMMAAALKGDFIHVPGVVFRYRVNLRPLLGWNRRPGISGLWFDVAQFSRRVASVLYLVWLSAVTVGRSAGPGYGLLAGCCALVKVTEQFAGFVWWRMWPRANTPAKRA